MANKQAAFRIKGMNKDLSQPYFSNEYAYDIKNMRLTPTSYNNTLLGLSNEMGNKRLKISTDDGRQVITGSPIGGAVVDKELILFTALEVPESDVILNFIYSLEIDDDTAKGKILYKGTDLLMDAATPLETLISIESEDIKKVYWVDGKNQPRVINIKAPALERDTWKASTFDFAKFLKLKESISVERVDYGGNFASGVIQYAISYYNKNIQESAISAVTPLNYISFRDRGASPEESVNCSFVINIDNIDTSFQYLRIYSIHRTSIDAVPVVKRVTDLKIDSSQTSISYTDNGLYGDNVDPTSLLYLGSEVISAGTIAQKDNTLFLGDITITRDVIPDEIINEFSNGNITYSAGKALDVPLIDDMAYAYESQLKHNSQQIKGFKYLETYRFGVQFQHKSGKWSEPIWINDATNNVRPFSSYSKDGGEIILASAFYYFRNVLQLQELVNLGYVNARPVIVLPKPQERNCVCQGILCPTVYNVSHRANNLPFSQSSWFIRPNVPFDIYQANNGIGYEVPGDWEDRQTGEIPSERSRAGILYSSRVEALHGLGLPDFVRGVEDDIVHKGEWLEFRHDYPIPDNSNRNSEIQCISNVPKHLYLLETEDIDDWVKTNKENFFIDNSIVTLHSPDIEFNELVTDDIRGCKLRIVGIVPMTSFSSDIDISVTSIGTGDGLYKEDIGVGGISPFGYRSIASGVYWMDGREGNSGWFGQGLVVYPFHRDGSMINAKNEELSRLKQKRILSTKYSYKSVYLSKPYDFGVYDLADGAKIEDGGISDMAIWNSNELQTLKLNTSESSGIEDDITYYGNVDDVLSSSTPYTIMYSSSSDNYIGKETVYRWRYIPASRMVNVSNFTSTNPVSMKYKSSPHAVIALQYTSDGLPIVLPTLTDGDKNDSAQWPINSVSGIYVRRKTFWGTKAGAYQYEMKSSSVPELTLHNGALGIGPEYGWLWLGEIYRDDVVNKFGGTTKEAFQNNIWRVAGDTVPLIKEHETTPSALQLKWTEGDTYYQRYDHIKTYPFTTEDRNQITEVVSFMCETRTNIDGRYDRNRGNLGNFSIAPTNFNLGNPVYSQDNNYFTYRQLDESLKSSKFPNTITWTKTKSNVSLIDDWTNITLASTLDLDGSFGRLTALKLINNNLLAFQEKGISQIMYNENVQISSTSGVPIEIANSGKVEGKRYISTGIGCSNKWSMTSVQGQLWFVDDHNKGIYRLSNSIEEMSSKLGFISWINNVSNGGVWSPKYWNNMVTYYDPLVGDIMFITRYECLAFSTIINQFSSFYSYEKVPYFFTIGDKTVSIVQDKGSTVLGIWLQHAGSYNKFYGVHQPFHITMLASPDYPYDKIFNTVEFRADSFDEDDTPLPESTFDELVAWNEYQYGYTKLSVDRGRPSSLKRKFRIWRANIPRSNGRDRMRNPWLYIKLQKSTPNEDRLMLYDISVGYTI